MSCLERIAPTDRSRSRLRALVAKVQHALRCGDDEGQSAVELALCLPILLLVLTGIFTFGLAFNNYLMLTQATDSGARELAISRGQTTDPCATVASAVYAGAPTLKQASLGFAYTLNGHAYTGVSCSSGSTTTGAAANLAQGTTAQLTVTYPCNLTVFGKNYAPSCTLKAKTAEMVQ